MARHNDGKRPQRGMTLIEVLIAFLILFAVALSVIEMFTLATAVNMGSLARTDLAYKCERVVETVRTQYALSLLQPPTNNACCPLVAGTTISAIPQTGCEAFWTDAGVGLEANARYTLSYTIVLGGIGRIVTATAQPNTTGNYQYLGAAGPRKAVSYVAQMQ